MAEITTRKRGMKWEYGFEGARVNGKRRRITKGGFRTKKEALEAGAQAKAEYDNSGTVFQSVGTSVSDFMDYWFDTYIMVNTKYHTQISYRGIIKNHIKPALGDYRLNSISSETLQEFINSKYRVGYKKNYLTNILAVLSGAFRYAVHPCNYRKENPCRYVRIPKYPFSQNDTNRAIITKDVFNSIMERFPEGNIFYIPLMLGYYTGLRIGEAFCLTWDDIDFENATINVNKSIYKRIPQHKTNGQEEGGAWYFGSTKNNNSQRHVKIGNTLLIALKKEKSRQSANELYYGEFYTSHYLKPERDENNREIFRMIGLEKSTDCKYKKIKMICVRENGRYVSTDSFKYCSRIIHSELNFIFNYHSLRHTHATILYENGAPLKDIQERLGHINMSSVTETIYVHNTDRMRSISADIFEKAVK